MDQDVYFSFNITPDSVPVYRYSGGTKGLSELQYLSQEETLKYIQQHARVEISQRLNVYKDKDKGKDLWEHGRSKGGIQGVLSLNQAIAHLPSELWEQVHKDIREILTRENLDLDQVLNLAEEKEDLSPKIQVQTTKQKGRYIVATENISVGETILQESPFISYLHSSHKYSNCATCLRSVVLGIGCSNCNQVIFCSKFCASKGTFHTVECGKTDILPGCGPVSPVIRIFTKHGLPFFKENANLFNQETSLEQLNSNKDISELCQLQAGNRKDSMYRLEKAAWTYFVLFLLKELKFFNNHDCDSLGEDEFCIGQIVENFLKISDNNCHEICELDVSGNESIHYASIYQDNDDISKVVVVVGAAIYLKTSLFNNSCDVNTMKCHMGTLEIMKAKRDIKAGEEVSDFYGEYFFTSDKFSRKKNLGFSCCCTACRENWPLMDDLPAFTQEDLETRYDWVLKRIELENAAEQFDVEQTKTICETLGRLANVKSPHDAFVIPEMYLHFSNLLLNNSRSLRFSSWALKHMKSK